MHRAFDRKEGRHVAIKFFRKKFMTQNSKMAARLERRLLKKMNHPNIISYYDDYEDINYIGIVMELMANDLR